MKGRDKVGFSLTWGPFHPDLERAFLSELKRNRDADPLAPLTVLVPNFQLVRYLRRQAARECGAIFNLRFETLALAVDRTTGPGQLQWGTRPLQEALKPWVLRGLAEKVLTAKSPLRSLEESPGLFRSLATALDELRQGGFNTETMETAAKKAPGPLEASQAREWASWMREYSAWKTRHRFHDREDLMEAALKSPVADGEPTWVYGFYDANVLQRKVLLHLAGHQGDRWFVPYRERAAYAYARPFFEWSSAKAGKVSPAPKTKDLRTSPLPQLNERLFGGDEGVEKAPGRALTLLLAPGGAAEMEEGARSILLELERHPGSNLSDAAVLFRFPDASRRDATDAFEDLGIPVENRLRYPLLSSPTGKAAHHLLETMDTDLARAPFMDLLACPTVDPKGFGLSEVDWNPSGWDLLTKELKYTRGAGTLVDRLRAEVRRVRGEGSEDRPDRLRDAVSLLKVTMTMADLAAKAAASKSWEGSVGILASALTETLHPSRERDELVETLEGLAEMEGKGEPFLPERMTSVARSLWEDLTVPPKEVMEGGVRFLDLMGARGLSFDVVAVPGLASGAFPPGPHPDPLLPEETRSRYNVAGGPSGARLPLKASSLDEERLLFAIAVGSARRCLLLTAPLADPLTGDARNPSSYLYEVLEAVTGEHHRRIEEATEHVRIVGSADRERRKREESLTAREVLSAALRRAREGKGVEQAHALALRSPFAREGARLVRERQIRRAFTPYDGVFDDPEAIRALAGADGLTGMAVSASRIETYASCPLKYFFRYVLHLDPVNEPEDALRADPLERGTLLHSILETVVREGLKSGWWDAPVEARDSKRALAFLEETARSQFDAFEKNGVTGAPALWRADRKRHLSDLRRLLLDLMRDPEWVPFDVEKPFGMDGAPPVDFPLPDGVVKLKGRIDRVDHSSSVSRDKDAHAQPARPSSGARTPLTGQDGKLRIVDYKTGRMGADYKDQDLRGGRRIQLALYLWAAKALYPGRRPVAGLYEFFTEEGGHKRVRHETADDDSVEATRASLVRVLGTVSSGVSRGLFPAMARDCSYCDFQPLCGVEQEKRKERKIGDERVKDLLAMEDLS